VVYLARVATELGDASGVVLAAQVDIQVVVRPVIFCRVVARRATRSVRQGRATPRPFQAIRANPFRFQSHHHGELLLRLPGSSGTPPVSRQGAAFAARNHRETMKKAGHGQPRRGGVNRDGQINVCPFGGGVLGSHRGDQVALLRSIGVRGSEGIGSGDTRSSQLTRAHLGRLNA